MLWEPQHFKVRLIVYLGVALPASPWSKGRISRSLRSQAPNCPGVVRGVGVRAGRDLVGMGGDLIEGTSVKTHPALEGLGGQAGGVGWGRCQALCPQYYPHPQPHLNTAHTSSHAHRHILSLCLSDSPAGSQADPSICIPTRGQS